MQAALEQLHNRTYSTTSFVKLTNKYRKKLKIPAGERITKPNDRLKIYKWERAELNKTARELNNTHGDDANSIQVKTDANVIQSLTWDKFTTINYRLPDNTRRSVQIEQFYVDALKAVGITDIGAWVSGCFLQSPNVDKVTKIVKREIVNELLKRGTL